VQTTAHLTLAVLIEAALLRNTKGPRVERELRTILRRLSGR
jgi:hypothetical protein